MKITREQIDYIESKAAVDEDIVRAALSRIPPAWNLIEKSINGGAFVRGTLQVIFSVLKYEDNKIWIHVSVCGRTGKDGFYTPSFEEFKRVKNDFIGKEKWAYQVFPSSKNYINLHPNVLHLFSLLDGSSALPDFTWGLGSI